MTFDWDPHKSQSNLEKHGVRFEEAQTVFNDIFAVIIEDRFHSLMEQREIIVGQSAKNRLLYVVFIEKKECIRIISATMLLPGLLAPEGCWTRRKPTRAESADIDLGWKLAKEIGKLDIGQCIVIGGGSVLAVEAIDGTDATIKRGAALGKGNASVVKICEPDQDLRFDMPAVGRQTIETMITAGATALAIEAGKTVVFNRDEMIDLANREKVAIVARH